MRFSEWCQRIVLAFTLGAQAFVPFALRFPVGTIERAHRVAEQLLMSRWSAMGPAGLLSLMSRVGHAQSNSEPESNSSSSGPPSYESSPENSSAAQGQAAGFEMLRQAVEMLESNGQTGAVTASPKDSEGNAKANPITVTPQDIYGVQPSQEQTQDLQDYYGQDGALRQGAMDREESVKEDTSPFGEAAATVRMGVDRPHPNLSHDPIITRSSTILQQSSELTRDFADCREVVVHDHMEPVEHHVPDIKTCERAYLPSGAHTLYHDYDVKPLLLFDSTDGWYRTYSAGQQTSSAFAQPSFSFEPCGDGCMDVYVGMIGNDYWQSDSCGMYEQLVVIDVKRPEVLRSAKLEYVRWSNDVQVLANGRPVFNQSLAPENGQPCSSSIDQDSSPSIELKSDFTAGPVEIRLKASAQARKETISHTWPRSDDERWYYSEAYAKFRLTFDTKSLVVDRGWYPQEAVKAAKSAGDAQCADSEITIERGPELDAEGCGVVSGIRVCPRHFDPSPTPKISPLVAQAHVEVHCNFLYGTTCWTNREGQEQCYTTTEENTSGDACAEYEGDPECTYVSSRCVEGAQGDSGECYLYENVFDCGETVTTQRPVYAHRTECSGPISCMGEECVRPDRTLSDGMAKAASVLSAANLIATDTQCDGQGHCYVFKSKPLECRKIWHGAQDCCIDPGPVSMAQYLELVYSIYQIQDGVDVLGAVPGRFGMWMRLAQGSATLYSGVSGAITSILDGIGAATTTTVAEKTGEAAAESAAETFLNEILQELMNKAAQTMYDMFGEAVTNMIFQDAGTGGAAASGGSLSTSVGFSEGVSAFIGFIGWVYLIYAIVTILIPLIWPCEDAEFELAVDRALKKCVYLGQYCDIYFGGANESMGSGHQCWRRKQTSCCFNSPFARIVMQQVAPQLGMSWGDAEHPSCPALPVQQMDDVDWTKVDLSEWIAILTLSGKMPDAQEVLLNMETLTGEGSDFDTGNRPNAAERTEERMTDMHPDEQRESVRQNEYENSHDGNP